MFGGLRKNSWRREDSEMGVHGVERRLSARKQFDLIWSQVGFRYPNRHPNAKVYDLRLWLLT